jgi:hypothetical protein
MSHNRDLRCSFICTPLIRRFEVDDELEFDRPFEGNISSFDAFDMST